MYEGNGLLGNFIYSANIARSESKNPKIIKKIPVAPNVPPGMRKILCINFGYPSRSHIIQWIRLIHFFGSDRFFRG
jgi:hypothetical protein